MVSSIERTVKTMKEERRETRAIVCLQTVQTFCSVYAAAKAAGVAASSIWRAIDGGRPCKGLYYDFLPDLLDCNADALQMWCAGRLLDLIGMGAGTK